LVDFFRAIFFVALGALVVLPSAGEVAAALVLALLVMVLTPPMVAVVAEWSGLTSRPAIESGVLLAQTSEYSLMLGLIGMRLEHLSPAIFGVIALMAVVTMTCTPLLARDAVTNWLLHWHPLRNRRKLPGLRCEGHVLMLGLGSAGMYVLRPLRAAGVSLVVVDDDPAVIAELDALGIPCVRGDGADEHTLERVGAAQARVILALMRRVADARTVLRAVKDVPVLVRVFEDADARLVERLGGIPVSNAEAALKALERSEFLKIGS
jgi:CPA2 family monovalent cation:H+ antiporter-2